MESYAHHKMCLFKLVSGTFDDFNEDKTFSDRWNDKTKYLPKAGIIQRLRDVIQIPFSSSVWRRSTNWAISAIGGEFFNEEQSETVTGMDWS